MRQPARQPEIARAIAHAKPSRKEVEALLADMPQDTEKPVHLLVADEKARCRSNLARCHVSPPVLPRRALTRIGADRYVASPHFLLQQMAPSLSLVELVCLGTRRSAVQDYRPTALNAVFASATHSARRPRSSSSRTAAPGQKAARKRSLHSDSFARTRHHPWKLSQRFR